MAGHSNLLLDLPPEIVGMMADQLLGCDVLQLRLADKEVAARVERVVTRACFTCLHIRA